MRTALAVIALALWAGGAAAQTAGVGDIRIEQPWARASLGNVPNSVAYLTLENAGAEPDRLIAASSPVAQHAQLHMHVMEDGIAKMRPVEAIEVAPGTPTALEPGGLHLMLMGLEERLVEGETLPLTLVFERAGEVSLEVPILAPTARGPAPASD